MVNNATLRIKYLNAQRRFFSRFHVYRDSVHLKNSTRIWSLNFGVGGDYRLWVSRARCSQRSDTLRKPPWKRRMCSYSDVLMNCVLHSPSCFWFVDLPSQFLLGLLNWFLQCVQVGYAFRKNQSSQSWWSSTRWSCACISTGSWTNSSCKGEQAKCISTIRPISGGDLILSYCYVMDVCNLYENILKTLVCMHMADQVTLYNSGSQQYNQAEEERESGQVGGSPSQGTFVLGVFWVFFCSWVLVS